MAVKWEPQQTRKPEAVFASKVMATLRQLYGQRLWETAIRGGMGQRSGIPDRLICIDGRFVSIEFKNPDGSGKVGPKQKVEMTRLQEAGAVVLVVQSWKDLDPIFDTFRPNQQLIRR